MSEAHANLPLENTDSGDRFTRFDAHAVPFQRAEKLEQLRIVIAGGGTGGHIIPALAVARELVGRESAGILFIGTQRGMEIRLVPGAGFPSTPVDVGQLKNVSLMPRIRTLINLPRSISVCK